MPTTVQSPAVCLDALLRLPGELQAWRVYRCGELAGVSTAVNRHLRELVTTGNPDNAGTTRNDNNGLGVRVGHSDDR
ncbi:hypothetical protein E4O93_17035 [Diaphorobacter sp. DS2]|nr:hypothetical protein E4O93_17035 [Diaphorobacter sp. DS2]